MFCGVGIFGVFGGFLEWREKDAALRLSLMRCQDRSMWIRNIKEELPISKIFANSVALSFIMLKSFTFIQCICHNLLFYSALEHTYTCFL